MGLRAIDSGEVGGGFGKGVSKSGSVDLAYIMGLHVCREGILKTGSS